MRMTEWNHLKKFTLLAKGVGLCAFLVMLLSSTEEDRFQRLIEGVRNDTLRMKLIEFKSAGIEKAVALETYDVDKVTEYARTFVGAPHKMGGTTAKGIDCSGLVYAAHAKFGVKLPHSSHEQARYGWIVPRKDSIQKGDILFFYNSYKTSNFITHCGIYLGEGKFIHASSKRGVIIDNVDDPAYWNQRYLFATRFKMEPADSTSVIEN